MNSVNSRFSDGSEMYYRDEEGNPQVVKIENGRVPSVPETWKREEGSRFTDDDGNVFNVPTWEIANFTKGNVDEGRKVYRMYRMRQGGGNVGDALAGNVGIADQWVSDEGFYKSRAEELKNRGWQRVEDDGSPTTMESVFSPKTYADAFSDKDYWKNLPLNVAKGVVASFGAAATGAVTKSAGLILKPAALGLGALGFDDAADAVRKGAMTVDEYNKKALGWITENVLGENFYNEGDGSKEFVTGGLDAAAEMGSLAGMGAVIGTSGKVIGAGMKASGASAKAVSAANTGVMTALMGAEAAENQIEGVVRKIESGENVDEGREALAAAINTAVGTATAPLYGRLTGILGKENAGRVIRATYGDLVKNAVVDTAEGAALNAVVEAGNIAADLVRGEEIPMEDRVKRVMTSAFVGGGIVLATKLPGVFFPKISNFVKQNRVAYANAAVVQGRMASAMYRGGMPVVRTRNAMADVKQVCTDGSVVFADGSRYMPATADRVVDGPNGQITVKGRGERIVLADKTVLDGTGKVVDVLAGRMGTRPNKEGLYEEYDLAKVDRTAIDQDLITALPKSESLEKFVNTIGLKKDDGTPVELPQLDADGTSYVVLTSLAQSGDANVAAAARSVLERVANGEITYSQAHELMDNALGASKGSGKIYGSEADVEGAADPKGRETSTQRIRGGQPEGEVIVQPNRTSGALPVETVKAAADILGHIKGGAMDPETVDLGGISVADGAANGGPMIAVRGEDGSLVVVSGAGEFKARVERGEKTGDLYVVSSESGWDARTRRAISDQAIVRDPNAGTIDLVRAVANLGLTGDQAGALGINVSNAWRVARYLSPFAIGALTPENIDLVTAIAKGLNVKTHGIGWEDIQGRLVESIPDGADARTARFAAEIARQIPDAEARRIWDIAQWMAAKEDLASLGIDPNGFSVERIEKLMAADESGAVPVESANGELKTVNEIEAASAKPEQPAEVAEADAEPIVDRSLELAPVEGKDGVFQVAQFPGMEIVSGRNEETGNGAYVIRGVELSQMLDPANREAFGKLFTELAKDGFDIDFAGDDAIAEVMKMAADELVQNHQIVGRENAMVERGRGALAMLEKSGLATEVLDSDEAFDAALRNSRNAREFRASDGTMYGFEANGKIYLNSRWFGTRTGLETKFHEFGHLGIVACRTINGELYNRGVELAWKLLNQKKLDDGSPNPFRELLTDELYSKGSMQDLCEEVLARIVGERGADILKAENESGVIAEIRQWVREFWKEFGNSIGLADLTEDQVANMTIEQVADAINAEMLSGRKFGEMRLPEGTKAAPLPEQGTKIRASKAAVGPSSLGDGKQRYYEVPFSSAVDKIVRNKKPVSNENVFVSNTPAPLKDIGVTSLPVVMNQQHVLSCYYGDGDVNGVRHPHGLKEKLKLIPSALQHPLMIIASETHPESGVVSIVSMVDSSGKNIIVPIEIDGVAKIDGGFIDANIVRTAFGKRNLWSEKVASALRAEADGKVSVFYVDKSKAKSIGNRLAREAFELGETELQLLRIPRRSNVVHSIDEFGSPVKGVSTQVDSKQFKRWFGKSVVRSEDGKPKVVYHQTENDFSAFDLEKARKSMDVQGIFFSGEKDPYNEYGSKTYPVYLRLENPYVVDSAEKLAYASPDLSVENGGVAVRKKLMAEGYDGIIRTKEFMGMEADEYIIFDPSQAKHAYENEGTFDGGNNNIRAYAGGRNDGSVFFKGRVRLAEDDGRGETTNGAIAASRELSTQHPTPASQVMRSIRQLSLPISEMEFLRKQLTGNHAPTMVTDRIPGGANAAHTRNGKLVIAADVFGTVDKADMARVKNDLRLQGLFANEDNVWCATHSPAEQRRERLRSEDILATRLLDLADRRTNGQASGGESAARGIFADELAKIVMDLPRQTGGTVGRMQTIGEGIRREIQARVRAAGGRNADAERIMLEQGGDMLDYAYGQKVDPATGNPVNRRDTTSLREMTSDVFGAFMIMPYEVRNRAPQWFDAIVDIIAGTPKLEQAWREMTAHASTEQASEYVIKKIVESQNRASEVAIAALNADGNEPIKAKTKRGRYKETVVTTFDDRLGCVTLRIDEKTALYLNARKAALKAATNPADKAAIQQEIDLFTNNIAQLKNTMELSRTAFERGFNNEGRRYFLKMAMLENEATERWGIGETDKATYLNLMRVIETQGKAGSFGITSRQARIGLDEMRNRLGPEKWNRIEEYGRKFHSIIEQEILGDPRVAQMFGQGWVDYCSSQVHYVTTKRQFSQEELVAIDLAREQARRNGVAGGDDIVSQMYDYAGKAGGEGGGEDFFTKRLKGSMASSQEARSATWEKHERLMQAVRKNAWVISIRDALLAAGVEGVSDWKRTGVERPENARYGRINYMENGQKRTLVVPRQIAEGMKWDIDRVKWISNVNNLCRKLFIDWNVTYWNRNINRNAGSIEKNVPGMHENWLKSVLRGTLPGAAQIGDVTLQHIIRHLDEKSPASRAIRGLFGQNTVLWWIPQAKRIANIVTDPTKWQQKLWAAEDRGDVAAVAEMQQDLLTALDALKANMYVGGQQGRLGEKTEGFVNDMMQSKGYRTIAKIRDDAASRPTWKKAWDAVNIFGKNAEQQNYEDVLAKTVAYLHDRAKYGLQRSIQETGLVVKKNVSIGEGERSGNAKQPIKKLVNPFWNMIEKGVVRHWRAVKERTGETLGKDAVVWGGRLISGLFTSGLVAYWIRRLYDGDEEKIAASKLAKVYNYARWVENAQKNLSAYVRKNYMTTPLWTSPDGYTSIVLGLPLNDEDKLITPTADLAVELMAHMAGIGKDPEVAKAVADSTIGAITPDFQMAAPIVNLFEDTVGAMMIGNPIDGFRGMPKYDEDLYRLRGESWEMAGKFSWAVGCQVWNDLGGRMIIEPPRNDENDAGGSAPGRVSRALRSIPVVSPLLRSMMKIQVGSPEKDAAPITEAEKRVQSLIKVLSRSLMNMSIEKGRAIDEVDGPAYERQLARWQKSYNLDDQTIDAIEKKFLNGWMARENGDSEIERRKMELYKKANKMGFDEAEYWLERGEY